MECYGKHIIDNVFDHGRSVIEFDHVTGVHGIDSESESAPLFAIQAENLDFINGQNGEFIFEE